MARTSTLTQEQQVVLQAVYDEFKPTAVFPVFQHLDSRLDQEHGLDADTVLRTIAPELVAMAMPVRPNTVIPLRLAGVAHCDGAEDDLVMIARLLRWTVEKQASFRPASPSRAEQQVVTNEEAMNDLSAGGIVVSELELRRAYELLRIEHLYEGSGSTDSSWQLTLSAQLRKYRGVRNYQDLLRIIEEGAVSRQATSPMAGARPVVVVQPLQRVRVVGGEQTEDGRPTMTLDSLHPLVRDACAPRFAIGHYREGILKAVHALRKAVRDKSGLSDSDDSTLMGKALGGKDPHLRVADLSTETGQSIQRGTAHLAQGIVARVRNPLTHDDDELDPVDAMELAALISRVVRDVEAGKRPGDDQ
jgi:uncharacterized protein (TIGR02391 family)